MTQRPLILASIVAVGVLLAVVVYTRGGDKPSAAAAGPAPAAIDAPEPATRITQPPLVVIPALPDRPQPQPRPRPRPSRPAPAATPPPAPPQPAARSTPKPRPKPSTRRGTLKQAPLLAPAK
jgi:fused signal recognition particle receptor